MAIDPSGATTYGVSSARWRQVRPGTWMVVLSATIANATCFGADEDTVDPTRVEAVTVGFDIPCAPTASVSVEVGTDTNADHPIVDRGPSGTC